MNKLGFVPSDKNIIVSNYKKAEERVRNIYNKYGYKSWEYNDEQKKELVDAIKEFDSIKGKCRELGIRI